jgi:hypothetical protein
MPSPWRYLKDDWFYTKLAAFLFATSATIVVIVVALDEFLHGAFGNPSSYSTSEEVTYTTVLMLWAISNLIIIVGMFRFWVACDKSRPITRRIWFVIMVVGFVRLGVGAAVYCFVVYLPRITKRLARRTRTTNA